MEFTINRADFLKGLQVLQGVIDPRPTLPVLSNILIETALQENGIHLTATNLQIGIRGFYPASIAKEGRVVVNARKLFDLVREISDEQIKIKLIDRKDGVSDQERKIVVVCERAQFTLPILSAKDFPEVSQEMITEEDNEPKVEYNVSAAVLKQMIQRTFFASSTEVTQKVLSGVYLGVVEGNKIEMAALDGHRLAYHKGNVQQLVLSGEKESSVTVGSKRVVLSKRTLTEIIKIIESNNDEMLKFSFSGNQIYIKIGPLFFFSQLIEGEFPDFRKAIPKDNDKKVIVDRENFYNALKRVVLMADEDSKSVKLLIRENQMNLSTQSAVYGDGREDLEVVYPDKEEININFNARYILDILNGISDRVIIKLKDGSKGGIITEMDNEDYLAVIMPLQV